MKNCCSARPAPASPRKSTSTSAATIRQRRLRQRRRQGTVVIKLEVGARAVNCLIGAGLLTPQKRTDPVEVRIAFATFVTRALVRAAMVAREG